MAGLYLGGKLVTPVIEKEVAKTKFGASVDTWIGDVDANGVLKQSTGPTALNFAGVKKIGEFGLRHSFHARHIASADLSSVTTIETDGLDWAFAECGRLTSVDLSSLTTVGINGLYYAFQSCGSLTSVDLSSLQSVSSYGLYYAFQNCSSLTSVDLSSLMTVLTNGLYYAFQNCGSLTSVDLSSLMTVSTNGLTCAFYGCKKLATISFPSLTDVQANSFGTSTYSSVFYNCTALTEIHFRADMQATIEAMSQYANKWGATNATIYFDL